MATEKRLIYMDDTIEKLRAYAERKHEAGYTELANGILKAANYIHNNIVRVDAVEVVRCEKCRFFHRHTQIDTNRGDCWKYGISCLMVKKLDDFCSYGERRTDVN